MTVWLGNRGVEGDCLARKGVPVLDLLDLGGEIGAEAVEDFTGYGGGNNLAGLADCLSETTEA